MNDICRQTRLSQSLLREIAAGLWNDIETIGAGDEETAYGYWVSMTFSGAVASRLMDARRNNSKPWQWEVIYWPVLIVASLVMCLERICRRWQGLETEPDLYSESEINRQGWTIDQLQRRDYTREQILELHRRMRLARYHERKTFRYCGRGVSHL